MLGERIDGSLLSDQTAQSSVILRGEHEVGQTCVAVADGEDVFQIPGGAG